MSNHADGSDPEMQARFAKLFNDASGDAHLTKVKLEHLNHELGGTGKFPQGKITKRDQGEVQFAVGIDEGVIVIKFHMPMAWIGFGPKEARQLAASLIDKAEQLEDVGTSIRKELQALKRKTLISSR